MASDSQVESEGEGLDGESTRPSRYKLSLEEVEDLLGAIHTTLGIQEEKKEQLSLHNQMYQGLGEQKKEGVPGCMRSWWKLSRKSGKTFLFEGSKMQVSFL